MAIQAVLVVMLVGWAVVTIANYAFKAAGFHFGLRGFLAEKNPILATALNAEVGYETAAAIAKESAKTGRTVKEIAKEKTDLTDEQLNELLDPAKLCGDGGRNRPE